MNITASNCLLRGRLLLGCVACLVLAIAPISVPAATISWDGGAGTGNWGTATNWSNNKAWNSGNTANFDTDLANGQYTITLGGSDRAARNLTFSSGTATQGFTFSAGNTLTINNSAGIVNNDADTQTFATVITLGTSQTWNAASGALVFSGNVTNANRTLTLSGTSTSSSISGIIGNGTGGLTKTGTGTWTLSGVNTYTGATTINDGTLSVGTIGNGGVAGNLGAATTTASNLTLGGGTLQYTGVTASTNRNFVLTTGTTSTIDVSTGGTNLTISGASTATTGGLTKEGAGTLTLSGTNLYTGATTINAGTLSVGTIGNGGVAGNMGRASTAAANLTLGGGTLQYTGATDSTNRNFVLTTGTTSTIEVTTGATNLTISGASTATTGGLTKTGAGTLTLSGTNLYTGATRISDGTLSVSNVANGGTGSNLGASSNAAANLVFDGGTLEFTGATDSTNRNFTIIAGKTATIDVTTGATNLTISGASTATTGGLTKEGAGTLTLSGTNLYTGATTINAGTLSVGTIGNGGVAGNLGAASTTAANLTLGGGTLQYTGATASTNRNFVLTTGTTSTIEVTTGATNLTISGASTATTGGLTKEGAGTLTLSGTNLYTGATTINAGTLSVGTIGNGGVAGNLGAASTTATNLTLGGGTLQYTGVTASTNRNFVLTTGTTSTIEVTTGATNLTISGASTATTGGLTKEGAGTLTLSGTNLHSGTTTVNAGTLMADGSASLGATTGNVTVTAGTLALAGGADITAGSPVNAETITKSGMLTLAGPGASASTGALHAAGSTGETSQWLGNITLSGSATISAADNLLIIGNGSLYDNTIALGANTLTLNTTSATGVVPEFLNFPSFSLDSSNILINSAISGTGGLVKDGAGTVTMLAYPNNTYSGATLINDGKLIIGGDPYTSIISSASVTVGNNSGAADSAVLQMGFLATPPANNDLIGTSDANAGIASTSMTVNADGFFDMNGGSNGLVDLTLVGGHVGDSYLSTGQSSLLSVTGGITSSISAQTALINNWKLAMEGSDFNVSVADGGAATDLKIDAILVNGIGFTNSSTTNSLVKGGTGTLLLTAANTYQGITDIQGGILKIQHSAALGQVGASGGDTTNGTVVGTGAQLRLDGSGGNLTIGDETLTLNGTGVSGTGALLNEAGNNTYNGRIRLETDSRINAETGTSLIIASPSGTGATVVTGNSAGRTLTVGGAGNIGINSVIASNIGTLVKDGTGTLTLAGDYAANTTTAVQAGTLALNMVGSGSRGLSSATAVTVGDGIGAAGSATLLLSQSNQIADTAAVSLGADGLFNVNSMTETIGSIAGSGQIILGTGQLIAGGNDSSTAFSGTLAGDSASILTKAGTGALTINSNLNAAPGDFAGTLNLSAGELAFNVDNAFTGTVSIAAGTTLRLSNADLTIANLNFTGTGSITLDFGGTASSLNVTNLNLGANVTINIINWQNAVDYFFAANWTGAVQDITGAVPMNQVVFNSPTWSGSDTKWQGYDDQITPVPEPSTYGALLLGAMGAFLGYRRWRQAKAAKA